MFRFSFTILLSLIIVGGLWALVNRDKIENSEMLLSQFSEQFSSFSIPWFETFIRTESLQPISTQSHPSIRIATFKLNHFGADPKDEALLSLLSAICQRFDVVALRGLDQNANILLETLAELIKNDFPSCNYQFITDIDSTENQPSISAILYNAATLELDHLNWYSVGDPDGLMQRQPMVAWFRTQVADPQRAFTFTLVNAELNPNHSVKELAYLRELFRLIRNDGRGEDDVILVGDFSSWNQSSTEVQRKSGLTWVIQNQSTDIRHSGQHDNIIFNPLATVEFTGRSGVFDFMRAYNLRLGEAEALSLRMPIWAEFSVFEGDDGRVIKTRSDL